MPQQHQVLRCFKCKTYQVHLVKKKPKWECKLCREKQSIKKVFLNSDCAKECRILVQDLNLKNSELDDAIQENLDSLKEIVAYNEEYILEQDKNESQVRQNKTTMWARCLDTEEGNIYLVDNKNQSVVHFYDQQSNNIAQNTQLSVTDNDALPNTEKMFETSFDEADFEI